MARAAPVDPVQHIGQLGRRNRHHAVGRGWPDEAAFLQPLGVAHSVDLLGAGNQAAILSNRTGPALYAGAITAVEGGDADFVALIEARAVEDQKAASTKGLGRKPKK